MDYFLSEIVNLQPETLQLKRYLPCVKFFRIVSVEKTSIQLVLFHMPCKTGNSEISFETFTAMQLLNLNQTPSWSAFDLKACFNRKKMKIIGVLLLESNSVTNFFSTLSKVSSDLRSQGQLIFKPQAQILELIFID